MSTRIKDKTALVTGANRGIGRAIVEALLDNGATKVYAGARNTAALSELTEKYGERVVPLALDVRDAAQVNAAAGQAGDVEILVNNAGIARQYDLYTDSLDDVRSEFEVNYFGPLHMIRAFAPILKANGGGAIVNVSSVAGLVNMPSLPGYSDSKAAQHSLTIFARLSLAQQGTQVLGVYPGPVDTDMAKGMEWEKASPASVAGAILDGLEAGETSVFPDPVSENGFRAGYEAGSKQLEATVAEMMKQPA